MDDVDQSCGLGTGRRRRRSAEERRRVVEETLEVGASVARVALKHGVNANQVFQWRRLYRDGKLGWATQGGMKLLPVSVADDEEVLRSESTEVASSSSGVIHIERPGEIRISLEGNVDPSVIRAVLMSLRP